MKPILDRLKEPSTWKGLIVVLGAFGIAIEPEMQTHIIAVGGGLFGIIEILRREKK
jgi:hypothetical protein